MWYFRPRVWALALAATMVAATARAAELAPVPALPSVYQPATYDWTGFYFGGHVGVGLLADTVSSAAATPLTPLVGSISLNPYAVVGGAQIGANYEMAPWVFGIEGTWSASDISGSGVVGTTIPGLTERVTSEPKWFATATGRFGYADNDVLVYGKAGVAFTSIDYTQDLFIFTPGPFVSHEILTDTRAGFTVGVGIEYGMTENLSVKAEYDFLDFGTQTYNFVQTPISVTSDVHVFTIGFNYRFAWGGSVRHVGPY
ncbi:MAG TPA: outer membrane beta-barrel protein [Xanthobacteraceae bacterium]|jgi:outer membrane immunogenic protein